LMAVRHHLYVRPQAILAYVFVPVPWRLETNGHVGEVRFLQQATSRTVRSASEK
jgi:hypothetical protein